MALVLHPDGSWKQFAAFAMALLPLLSETAVTFTLCCRIYLLRRPSPPHGAAAPGAAIPTSIRRILLTNILLTLLLVCATMAEAVVVNSGLFIVEQQDYMQVLRAAPLADSLRRLPAPTPTNAWLVEVDRFVEAETQKEPALISAPSVSPDLLVLGLVWLVVVAYVGAVARVGLRVERSWAEVATAKMWTRMMRLVERSKWVALCFAIFFSFGPCFHFKPPPYWTADWTSPAAQWQHLVFSLLFILHAKSVWKWTAASSILVLLALTSFYTLAARIALYVCCKRFSLHQDDDESSSASSSFV